MKFTYLIIELCAVAIPAMFSFHRKIRFNKEFWNFLMADLIIAIPFLVWDAVFTDKGIWGFNEKYVTGLYIFNLPIEEVLFFICIPFACLFTYHSLTRFYELRWPVFAEKTFTVLLALTLIIVGVLHHENAYTFITFISSSILVIAMGMIIKADWLTRFYSSYFILLIPFFIVNGLLTGTGLSEPVVWYNEEHIIGIRLLTVPVEDIFYGMELLLMITFLFEEFKALSGLNKLKLLDSVPYAE